MKEKKIKQQKILKKLEEETTKAERKKFREQQLTAQKKETAKSKGNTLINDKIAIKLALIKTLSFL